MSVETKGFTMYCDGCEESIFLDFELKMPVTLEAVFDFCRKDKELDGSEGNAAKWDVSTGTTLCPNCKPFPPANRYSAYPDGNIPKLQDGACEGMYDWLALQEMDDPKGMGYIVDAYNEGTPEERRLINLVLVSLYGWTLQSIIEKSGVG